MNKIKQAIRHTKHPIRKHLLFASDMGQLRDRMRYVRLSLPKAAEPTVAGVAGWLKTQAALDDAASLVEMQKDNELVVICDVKGIEESGAESQDLEALQK